MVDIEQISTFLRNLRLNLGLTAEEAGQLVRVTRRTWEAWECGARAMPDAKRDLLGQKISSLGHAPSNHERELVVVVKDGLPIDVVANDNFLGLTSHGNGTATVSSLAVDGKTGRPYVRRTTFNEADNQHIHRASLRWKVITLEA